MADRYKITAVAWAGAGRYFIFHLFFWPLHSTRFSLKKLKNFKMLIDEKQQNIHQKIPLKIMNQPQSFFCIFEYLLRDQFLQFL